MSQYFSEFLINNHIKAIYKDTKKNFLCVDRGRINQALLCSFFSVLINHKYKFNPIILSDLKNEKITKLYKSFGFNKFLIGFRFFLLFTHPIIFLKSFFLTIKVVFLIKKNSLHWFVNKFAICSIQIGDLVHDYYVRNNHSYLNPKIDIKFINILFKALFRTLNISKIIKEKNIKYIVLGTETYAHNDGITLRLGLKNNIPVIEPSLATLDFFKYQRNHIPHGKRSIFYNNKVKLVKNFEKNIIKIDNFLKKRFLGKVKTGYTHFLHLKKTNKKFTNISRSKYLKINGFKKNEIKKVILFSCHAFSDANHGVGNNFLFLDYYDHLKKTLEFVNKINNPNILWIVRPNPTSEFTEEYELIQHLVKKFNNKKIILSSKKITSFDLLKISDNVITGRGTVGMEFACLGKYPITVGSGVYSNLDFSLEFKSKKNYFQQLKNIENIKRLSKKQILLAKQTLYYLENTTDKFFVEYFQDREKKIFIKNSKLLIDRSILPYIQGYSKKSIFCKKLLINLKNFSLNDNSYIEYILKKI
tara:strand:- start:76 stop:1665 length:1590 start_codon:yes stop_codon:yes gene_type:complete